MKFVTILHLVERLDFIATEPDLIVLAVFFFCCRSYSDWNLTSRRVSILYQNSTRFGFLENLDKRTYAGYNLNPTYAKKKEETGLHNKTVSACKIWSQDPMLDSNPKK